MRKLIIGLVIFGVVAVGVYAAPLTTGTIKTIGGGTDTAAHCQVQDYDIAASDTISSINALVECDITGTYDVTATVTSGTSSSGTNAGVSLTAGSPLSVTVTLGASVTISSSAYTVDVQVKK